MALALILLNGAGVLLRSFQRLQDVNPGFDPSNLLVADLPVSPVAHANAAERMTFFDRILDRARSLPGVRSAGATASLPVTTNGMIIHFNIQGRPPKSPRDFITVGARPVSPHYLETLRVPLLRGRLLEDRDTERAPFVAVVNQAMARQFFPGESPLGKHVQLGGTPENGVPWMEIVGVVGDLKQDLAVAPTAEMYMPFRQFDTVLPVYAMSLVLRTMDDPLATVSALRRVVHDVDPDQPLIKTRTMEQNIAVSVTAPRFRATLLSIFAGSALLLAIVGFYGLMSYTVTQRVPEIGIRACLGAQRSDVLGMVLREGFVVALAGEAVGVCGAFLLSRFLSGFLYGVSGTDVRTMIEVGAAMLLAAMLACYIPARRAASVEPLIALRYE